ncbi:hypothetical protein ACFPYJ_19440 [Paenibacillus solisilvae]|uniref:Uncharacterized protein n=1 Tax=Paenibacillus solisilvae TaxID=2486751 RepID=A0ABW0VZ85_9BACL
MKYGVRITATGEYLQHFEPPLYTKEKIEALNFDSEVDAALFCRPFEVIDPFFEEGEELTGVCHYCKERLADSTGLENACASCGKRTTILGIVFFERDLIVGFSEELAIHS